MTSWIHHSGISSHREAQAPVQEIIVADQAGARPEPRFHARGNWQRTGFLFWVGQSGSRVGYRRDRIQRKEAPGGTGGVCSVLVWTLGWGRWREVFGGAWNGVWTLVSSSDAAPATRTGMRISHFIVVIDKGLQFSY